MAFTFQPLSDEEISMMGLIEPGLYQFEVMAAEEKISKSGNQMIELKLKVWDNQGTEHHIFDYLVSQPTMMYKVKHFCDSVGLIDQYKRGAFQSHQCLGKIGQAKIIVQKGKPKDNGDMFPDKNSVSDYVTSAKAASNNVAQARIVPVTPRAEPEHDDDIPF